MAEQQNNQFFLAVTATVALVSIVALVILVLGSASPRAVSYAAPTLESADAVNVAGDARGPFHQDISSGKGGAGAACTTKSTCTCIGAQCKDNKCTCPYGE